MIIKVPSGPIKPVLEGLDDNHILRGWVSVLEDSSSHQITQLRENGTGFDVIDGIPYEIYHGIDGNTWALDTLFSAYFPNLQRIAAFLAIWGIFERHFHELCDRVASSESLEIRVRDLNGSGLTRARTYLTKVAGLRGEWSERLWQEVPDLQRLRNLFAHSDGRLEEKHLKERQYVGASSHLAAPHDVVHLEASFLEQALDIQRNVLENLHELVLNRYGDGT